MSNHSVQLTLGELHIATGDFATSMTHLLKCKATCDAYHMQNLSAIASLFIAEVQVGITQIYYGNVLTVL